MADAKQRDTEIVADVMRLYRWKWTYRAIAQALDLSLGMVNRIIKENEKQEASQ